MKTSTVMFLPVVLLLVSIASPANAESTSRSLSFKVYSDGSAAITQTLSANASSSSITVHLLSQILSNPLAFDENGSPLSFQISGSNITIYTLGASGVTLQYDTLNLTNKRGTVWTVSFTTYYNTTVILPQRSTLSSISGTPISISNENGSPVVSVAPGSWTVNYGVPIQISTTRSSNTTSTVSTTSTSTARSSSTSAPNTSSTAVTESSNSSSAAGAASGLSIYVVSVAIVLLSITAILIELLLRRRSSTAGSETPGLRSDDVKVLAFISEKGGKVLEPEIRTTFALPKTTAWRQIKRLERLGYVTVTKVGSQNQIEIVKNRPKEDGSNSR